MRCHIDQWHLWWQYDLPMCDVHVELLKEEMPIMSFLFRNYLLHFVMLIVNG